MPCVARRKQRLGECQVDEVLNVPLFEIVLDEVSGFSEGPNSHPRGSRCAGR